jgi:guanine nucleotide-binding protein G(i) subunit alpha
VLTTPIYSFFAETQRIVAEDYIPSIEDVLHTAERGILETYFNLGQLSIRVLQVYGQEYGRKKWINQFESVTSIIFCASLCDYDVHRVAPEGEQVCIGFLSCDLCYQPL